jgi:hypothetical protein
VQKAKQGKRVRKPDCHVHPLSLAPCFSFRPPSYIEQLLPQAIERSGSEVLGSGWLSSKSTRARGQKFRQRARLDQDRDSCKQARAEICSTVSKLWATWVSPSMSLRSRWENQVQVPANLHPQRNAAIIGCQRDDCCRLRNLGLEGDAQPRSSDTPDNNWIKSSAASTPPRSPA